MSPSVLSLWERLHCCFPGRSAELQPELQETWSSSWSTANYWWSIHLQQGKAEQVSCITARWYWQPVPFRKGTLNSNKHPTLIPYTKGYQSNERMKLPLLFLFYNYVSVGNRCSLIFPVLSQLVAHKSWVLDSHWISPLWDLQSGTQQAPKKMTRVDRYAAEIRSVDTVYLSIQALHVFNTQAFKSHIHHVQSKTEYLLLCAPHSVYRESIPTSITFSEIEPICKCWASISRQWPELQWAAGEHVKFPNW